MTKTTLTAIALILATIPVTGFAQNTTPPTMPAFDFAAADTDGSGGISAEEWTAYTAQMRATARAARVGARADALMAADANGDGMLSRDELMAGMMAQADARQQARGDGQGAMGRRGDEARGMRGGDRQGQGRGDHGRGEGCERGGHGGHGGHGHGGHDHGDRGGRWGDHDRGMMGEGRGMGQGMGQGMGDRQGAMRGQGPMDGQPGRGFAMMDQDGDGQISPAELDQAQAFMQRMMQRRQGNN